jgi:hypothetical protein
MVTPTLGQALETSPDLICLNALFAKAAIIQGAGTLLKVI